MTSGNLPEYRHVYRSLHRPLTVSLDREIRRAHRRARNGFHHGLPSAKGSGSGPRRYGRLKSDDFANEFRGAARI